MAEQGELLGMADLPAPGVVPLDARAPDRLRLAAQQGLAFGFGLHVHHFLLFGRVVAHVTCVGVLLLVDAHAFDVAGDHVPQRSVGVRAEEVAPVHVDALDLLAVGVEAVFTNLHAGQLLDQLRKPVVRQRLERSGVVDHRVALVDHGDLLAQDDHLADGRGVGLHLHRNKT